MKKYILLTLSLSLSNNLIADENFITDIIDCKSNVLHFATSVSNKEYVLNLIKNNTISLTELNKHCDTVYHIATQLGDTELLDIFLKTNENFYIQNKNGEDLIQTTIKYNQPKVLIHLLNSGANPYIVSGNGLNSFQYQNKIKNIVTGHILDMYILAMDLKNKEKENGNYSEQLDSLKLELNNTKLKMEESLLNNPDNIKEQEAYKQQIIKLENQILLLENVINKLEEEIKDLKEKLKNSDYSLKNDNVEINTLDKIEFKEDNNLIEPSPENNNKLIKVSSDGNPIGDSLKLFEILSKPIYKIEE